MNKYLAKYEIVQTGFFRDRRLQGTEVFEGATIAEAHKAADDKAHSLSKNGCIITILDIGQI